MRKKWSSEILYVGALEMKLNVAIVVVIVVVVGLLFVTGCQLDITGPDMSAKLLYESENDGEVHKSRTACAVYIGYKADFEKHYPHIQLGSNKVLLYLNGGVVEMMEKPMGIEVEIRNYDIEGDWDPDNNACKEDKDGDRYQEIQWTSIVELP